MDKIKVTVKSGKCLGGYHKVGDSFVVDSDVIPAGMCIGALLPILPVLLGLQHGAQYRWEKDKDKATIHCSDPKGIVIELERVK